METRAKRLSDEEQARVNRIWAQLPGGAPKRIAQIDLHHHDIACLQADRMLNDELMNAYFHTLGHPTDESPLSALVLNSFFYGLLERGGHARVAKWTRDVDLFAYDYVLVPIHIECPAHWCLLAVAVAWRRIDYYDSLYDPQHRIQLELVRTYLCNEYNIRHGFDGNNPRRMVPQEWKINELRCHGPQQSNLVDCGVFVCQIARNLLHMESPGRVKASDMLYYRQRMLLDLMSYD